MDTVKPKPDTSCLKEAELMAYFNGTLPPESIRKVELHILECPLCEEAWESLAQLSDRDKFEAHSAAFSDAITRRVNRKEVKVLPLSFSWRIAAVLTVLTVSSILVWYLVPQQKDQALKQISREQPSQATEAAETTEPIAGALSSTKPETNTASVNEINSQEPGQLSISEEKVAAESFALKPTQKDIADEAVMAPSAPGLSEKVSSDNGRTTASDVAVDMKETQAATVQNMVVTGTAAKKVNLTDQAVYEQGIAAYERANYAECISLLEPIVQFKMAKHYLGVASFELKNYSAAIGYLQDFQATKTGSRHEPTAWYLASAYLKTNQKAAAIAGLEACIKLKGKHEKEARELLKNIAP